MDHGRLPTKTARKIHIYIFKYVHARYTAQRNSGFLSVVGVFGTRLSGGWDSGYDSDHRINPIPFVQIGRGGSVRTATARTTTQTSDEHEIRGEGGHECVRVEPAAYKNIIVQ